MKYFIFFVIALNWCEDSISSDVVTTVNVRQKFIDAHVVTDAVNVAPQKEIRVRARNDNFS